MVILVVDDNKASLKMASFLLSEEGHTVLTAASGQQALQMVHGEDPDLIVLDVMMPMMSGFDLCRQIRKSKDVPILFLSARGQTADKVEGLELGGDDYLAKPYEPSEFVARVSALLRRYNSLAMTQEGSKLTIHDHCIDISEHKLQVRGGDSIQLTPVEFKLLYCLAINAGKAMTRETLLNNIWGADSGGDSNEIDVYIRRLRTKIERVPAEPEYLLTVRGIGYKLRAPR